MAVLLTAHTCENETPATWRNLVEKHFPADQHNAAMTVLHCESRGRHHAINNKNPNVVGLFQIDWDNLYAPVSGAYVETWQPIFDRDPKLLGRRNKRWIGEDIAYIKQRLQEPELNIELAAALVAARGWVDWACRP